MLELMSVSVSSFCDLRDNVKHRNKMFYQKKKLFTVSVRTKATDPIKNVDAWCEVDNFITTIKP